MTNEINRILIHPDTGEQFISEAMSDEEVNAAFDNPQVIRDRYALYTAAQAAKQADLDEIRDAKLTAALTALNSDIANFAGTPTNAQVITAVRHLLNIVLVLVKIVARLV